MKSPGASGTQTDTGDTGDIAKSLKGKEKTTSISATENLRFYYMSYSQFTCKQKKLSNIFNTHFFTW